MKPVFAILFLFLIGLSGCTPVGEADIDQNVKDYVSYAPGSYWIYRDSANHSIKDSVTVISNIFSLIPGGGGKPSPKQQILKTKYFSSRDSFYLIDGEDGYGYGYADIKGYDDIGEDIDTSTTINYFFNEPYAPSIGNFIPGPDSLKVKNTIYKNVYQFSIPQWNRTVFWSRHIGVIKSITRGKTWELDTCAVKQ